MSVELFYLGMYALVVIATSLAQQLTSIFNVGLWTLLGSREGVEFTGITSRLEKALGNSAIAMALFAPAVIILHVTQSGNAQTALVAQIFVTARIIYSVSYAFKILGLRSACYVAGLVSTLVLYGVGLSTPFDG